MADDTPAYSLRDGAIPDLTAVPPIGSRRRNDDERQVMARARGLVEEEDGRLREALVKLEHELRDLGPRRAARTRIAHDVARDYARELVDHVEQCWASAVLR